jgi:hypothetical protein
VIRPELRLELLAAVVLAAIVVLATPGLAFAGAIALALLIAAGASLLAARLRRRRAAHRALRRPVAPAAGIRLSDPPEATARRRTRR